MCQSREAFCELLASLCEFSLFVSGILSSYWNMNMYYLSFVIGSKISVSISYFIFPYEWLHGEYHLIFYTCLSHWGCTTHICVSKLTIIGPDNGLSPGRRQAIIWTNAGMLLIGPVGTIFSEILIRIHTLSLKKNAFENVWETAAISSRPQCVILCSAVMSSGMTATDLHLYKLIFDTLNQYSLCSGACYSGGHAGNTVLVPCHFSVKQRTRLTNPTMHQTNIPQCTLLYTKRCIVGYGTGVLWDLCNTGTWSSSSL